MSIEKSTVDVVIKRQVAESSEGCLASISEASPTGSMAVYKGLKVAVCVVNKTDLCLTRRDLIELINVCILFLFF